MVDITGIGIFRFSDGRVVESWDNFDQLGMMRQLGVMPSPECGLPYVKLARQPSPPVELLAAPVLQGERYQGRRSISPTSSSARTAPTDPSSTCGAARGRTPTSIRTRAIT